MNWASASLEPQQRQQERESVANVGLQTALRFGRPERGSEIIKGSPAAPHKKFGESTSRGKAQRIGRSLRLSLAGVNGTDVASGHVSFGDMFFEARTYDPTYGQRLTVFDTSNTKKQRFRRSISATCEPFQPSPYHSQSQLEDFSRMGAPNEGPISAAWPSDTSV